MNFSSETSSVNVSTVDGTTPATTSATYRYDAGTTFCKCLVEVPKMHTKTASNVYN